MKKTKKKGFTIVELVIVIAIIAILAAVLIPTFSNIIKKANRSADTQLVRNLNTVLGMDLAEKGLDKHATMYDAVEACVESGYIADKIVAKSDYNIAWSVKEGYFVLLDMETGIALFPESEEKVVEVTVQDKCDYFVVTKSSQYDASANKFDGKYAEYSVYAYGKGWPEEVTVSKGFDAGSVATFKKISYENNVSVQNVVIRTNSFDTAVSVDGALDTVTHYGQALSVDIIAVANASYDEKGEVKGNIIVTAGHLDLSEVEGTYYVIVKNNGVKVTRNEDTIVVVAGKDNFITVEIDGTNVSKENTPDKVYYLNDMTPAQISNTLALATKFAGVGTEELPFLLQNEDDYQTLAKEIGNLSTYKFKQTQDITVTEDLALDPKNNIQIDLNGKKLEITKDSKIGDKVVEASDNSKKISSNNNVTKEKDESDDNKKTENYLTFTATGDSTITVHAAYPVTTVLYSTDNGVNWKEINEKAYEDAFPDAYAAWFDENVKDVDGGYFHICNDNRNITWDEKMEYSDFEVSNLSELKISEVFKEYCCFNSYTIKLSNGQSVMFKGENVKVYFSMTGSIAASGSVTSLIDGKGVDSVTLTEYCFSDMFVNCTALTSAPELPATTLAASCYSSMFSGCTGLKTAPELPATELAAYCYKGMFNGCSNLKTAPELPATELAYSCYNEMFQDCSSLEKAPALPAETLANNCYACMFLNCTSLKELTLPDGENEVLHAVNLIGSCYDKMFAQTALALFVTDDLEIAKNGEKHGTLIGAGKTGSTPSGLYTTDAAHYNSSNLDKSKTWYWYIPKQGAYTADGYFGGFQDKDCGVDYINNEQIEQIVDSEWNTLECSDVTMIVIPNWIYQIAANTFSGFDDCENPITIVLPSSVDEIGGSNFEYIPLGSEIYYCGTKADWENTIKDEEEQANPYKGGISGVTIHCTNGDIIFTE